MGVTIHFEGRLTSQENFDRVIDTAKNFAEQNGLKYFLFRDENKLLERMKDEKDWNYEGPTQGIQLQPDENCDPLILEFDKDLYVQEFCKTQFAEASAHLLVIDLLRKIKPFFEHIVVDDEGEYWETNDINQLQGHINNCFKAIDDAKNQNEKLDGPFRLNNGRIVDLMEND